MSEHANTREKRLAALAVAVVVLVTVLLIVETFRLLLPGLWSAFPPETSRRSAPI